MLRVFSSDMRLVTRLVSLHLSMITRALEFSPAEDAMIEHSRAPRISA